MTRRVWLVVIPSVALLVVAARSTRLHRSSAGALVAARPPSDVVAGAAAVPRPTRSASAAERPAAGGAAPVLALDHAGDEEDADDGAAELRPRVTASPVFSRLPPPDQRWVLAQARARVPDANDPRLEQVVHELSEVRQFAASEREEPLAPLDPSR